MNDNRLLGVGLVALAGVVPWTTLKKKEPEKPAPYTLVDPTDPYAGTRYEGMSQEEAWSYYFELVEQRKQLLDPYKNTIYAGMSEAEAWTYYEKLKLEREVKILASQLEVQELLADVVASGYTHEGGIPEAYFIEKYGEAWAWPSGTPGRVEALRAYWLEHHPYEPLPKELQ